MLAPSWPQLVQSASRPAPLDDDVLSRLLDDDALSLADDDDAAEGFESFEHDAASNATATSATHDRKDTFTTATVDRSTGPQSAGG